jgi:hypothetical protein
MIMDTTPALLERTNICARSSAKYALNLKYAVTQYVTDRRVSGDHGIVHEKLDPLD